MITRPLAEPRPDPWRLRPLAEPRPDPHNYIPAGHSLGGWWDWLTTWGDPESGVPEGLATEPYAGIVVGSTKYMCGWTGADSVKCASWRDARGLADALGRRLLVTVGGEGSRYVAPGDPGVSRVPTSSSGSPGPGGGWAAPPQESRIGIWILVGALGVGAYFLTRRRS